jgi:hypothetical protein
VRLLHRLGDDVAFRHAEVKALVPGIGRQGHHAQALARRFFPGLLLVLAPGAEAFDLGQGRALARAELDAAVGDQVQRGNALGDARGVVVLRRHMDDAVAEADTLRALRDRRQKDLRGGRGAVFLQEMVLGLPDVIEAELIRELGLLQRLLPHAQLVALVPLLPLERPGNVELELHAELHVWLPSRRPAAGWADYTAASFWGRAACRRRGRGCASLPVSSAAKGGMGDRFDAPGKSATYCASAVPRPRWRSQE